MKIIDFYKIGNAVRLFLGNDDDMDYYGDDWNDTPYEHNAGEVYSKYVTDTLDLFVPLDSKLTEPADDYHYSGNSPFCKDDFKNGKAPCLLLIPGYICDSEWFVEYSLFIGDKRCLPIYYNQVIDDSFMDQLMKYGVLIRYGSSLRKLSETRQAPDHTEIPVKNDKDIHIEIIASDKVPYYELIFHGFDIDILEKAACRIHNAEAVWTLSDTEMKCSLCTYQNRERAFMDMLQTAGMVVVEAELEMIKKMLEEGEISADYFRNIPVGMHPDSFVVSQVSGICAEIVQAMSGKTTKQGRYAIDLSERFTKNSDDMQRCLLYLFETEQNRIEEEYVNEIAGREAVPIVSALNS